MPSHPIVGRVHPLGPWDLLIRAGHVAGGDLVANDLGLTDISAIALIYAAAAIVLIRCIAGHA
jgi:hypothetical protein